MSVSVAISYLPFGQVFEKSVEHSFICFQQTVDSDMSAIYKKRKILYNISKLILLNKSNYMKNFDDIDKV